MTFLIIYSIVITILFGLSCFAFVKLFLNQTKMEEIVDRALDELDQIELALTEILQKPLFFNNAEIRQAVDNVKRARQIVVNIAQSIEYPIEYEIEELTDEELKKQILAGGNVIRLDTPRE